MSVLRTKLSPDLCWIVGWAHVVHALTLILSLGLLYTSLPLKASTWACRVDQRRKGSQ